MGMMRYIPVSMVTAQTVSATPFPVVKVLIRVRIAQRLFVGLFSSY